MKSKDASAEIQKRTLVCLGTHEASALGEISSPSCHSFCSCLETTAVFMVCSLHDKGYGIGVNITVF